MTDVYTIIGKVFVLFCVSYTITDIIYKMVQ